MTTEERFNAAVEVIRGLPKDGSFQPSHDLQLKFYAYYKQATLGPITECGVPRPRFWDIVGNAKWDAWMKLGNMSKSEAMQKYVEELVKIIKLLGETASEDQIVEAMSYTDNVAKFMDLLGPLFDGMPQKEMFISRLSGNRESEDDIETLDVPEEETAAYPKEGKLLDEKQIVDILEGPAPMSNESSYESEDEFSDTYDHMAEEDGDSLSPGPEVSTFETTIGKAFQNGTERALAQENDSQLWEFYAGKKRSNGDLPNARGGGDEHQQRTGVPPRSVPSGVGRHARGCRKREGDPAAETILPARGNGGGCFHGGGSGGSREGRWQLPMEVSEQLAVAVLRLQQTMDEVVARLEALETLLQHSKSEQNQHWVLFGNTPPHILLLLFSWPIVLQLGLYVLKRRSRQCGLP